MAKKKRTSPKSRLIRSRDVRVIVNLMLESWAAKATSAMGGAQMLAGRTGLWDSEEPANWDGEVPTWEGSESKKQVVHKSDLFRGVMTLESARTVVNDTANDAIGRYEAMRVKSKREVKAGALKWRRKFAGKIARTIVAKERLIALAALETRLLPQNKRRGRQQIATSSRRAPDEGMFRFGGRKAVRMPVGRPALPSDMWLARYLSRKIRRQQKNATKIRRRRPLPVPPPTRFERPKVVELLAPKK